MRVVFRLTVVRLVVLLLLAWSLTAAAGTAEAYKMPPDTTGEFLHAKIPNIWWGWYPAGTHTSFGINEDVWVLEWQFETGCCYKDWIDLGGCPSGDPAWWWPDICTGGNGYAHETSRSQWAGQLLGANSGMPGRLAYQPNCINHLGTSLSCVLRYMTESDLRSATTNRRLGRCVRAENGQLFGEEGHVRNPSGCLSDPVNTATGSYATAATDIALPGIGLPFSLVRTYNSSDATVGPLGRGWTHSYAPKLTATEGPMVFRAENGAVVEFYRRPDGSFESGQGTLSRLVSVAGGGHELIRKDQVRYRFDASGQLASVRDRNGNELELEYTSGVLSKIVDTGGREITFEQSGGRLVRVALPDGRDVEYGYTSGLLTSVTDLAGKTTTHEYDSSGRLSKTVTPEGRTQIENEYGTDGRVSKQIDGMGEESSFAWNPATMTATMTDARGHVWTDVYDPNLVLEQRIDPLGNETTFDFNAELNPVAVTDARGNTTTSTFDARGNLLTRTTPAPSSYVETYTYDAENNLLTATNRRGYTTSYEYDTAGNLITITRPDPDRYSAEEDGPEVAPVTHLARDAATGLLESVQDARGKTTEYGYDAAGNLTSVTTPMGNTTTTAYDGSGRPTSRVEPRGNKVGADPDDYRTTFTFNANDRPLTVMDPLGHETSYVYDDDGKLISRTDAKNRTTGYAYNAAGELTTVTAPDLTVTAYDYDAAGNLISRTDAKNHTTTYVYDDANRLTKVTKPLEKVWTYGYDEVGNVTSRVDANGNATPLDPDDGKATYEYNELNQLVMINYGEGISSLPFQYNANGDLENFDGGGLYYDPLDRLSSVYHSGNHWNGGNHFLYAYDATGNITSRANPDETVSTYTYDDDGRLATASSGGATTTYGYDEAGNLTTTALPAAVGISESRTYDEAGRLTEIANQKGLDLLSRFTYTLDPSGNPTTVVSSGSALTPGTQRYDYDQLDRLIEVCYQQAPCTGAADPFIRWTYDNVGNRSEEERPSETTTYTYNAADELTESLLGSTPTTYTYDANGNQLTAGPLTFTYNRENRLEHVSGDRITTEYLYDALGMRLRSSTYRWEEDENGEPITGEWEETMFVWDLNNPLPQLAYERNGEGTPTRHYLNGHRPISVTPASTGSPSYYSFDRLDSVIGLHSETGANQWGYEYEPFGGERTAAEIDPAAPENRLRFNGQHLDSETGLFHLRARQYDSISGRFTATDPVAPRKHEPFVSAYAYANGRPTALVDPSGLRAESNTCGSIACWVGDGIAAIGNGNATVSYCFGICAGLAIDGNGAYFYGQCCGLKGPGATWSAGDISTDPLTEVGACYALCLGLSHNGGTGESSPSVGFGAPGVWGGPAQYAPLFSWRR